MRRLTPLITLAALALTAAAVVYLLQDRPQLTPAQTEAGEVVAVVDGDTIDVQLEDGTARIRLIGIDTPEVGRSAGAVDDCYAQEARTYLDELVYGQTVTLTTDPTQDQVDAYDRLLRYVTLDDQDVALAALTAGVGTEYTFNVPYQRQADYRAAEAAAQDAGAGLWGTCPTS